VSAPLPIETLLLGDYHHNEFSDAVAWLEQRTQLTTVGSFQEAEPLLREKHPRVVVLAQSRPGMFPRDSVDMLQATAPHSRWTLLLGSLCEGEMRTGEPYPGMLRVPWSVWEPWAEREFEMLAQGELSVWSLPLTAVEVDRMLALSARHLPSGAAELLVVADDLLTYESISDPCLAGGYLTRWLTPHEAAANEEAGLDGPLVGAIIVDLAGKVSVAKDRIRELRAQFEEVPIIALVNFPRGDDARELYSLGVQHTISKPWAIEDLLGVLANCISPKERPQALRVIHTDTDGEKKA